MDFNKQKGSKNSKQNKVIIIILLVLISLVSTFLSQYFDKGETLLDLDQVFSEGGICIHYVDVGQGDCVLIQDGQHNILIDTGTYKMSDNVMDFLKNYGVDYLDMLVLTHPHEDHIGAFVRIGEEYNIGLVLKSQGTATTAVYNNVESFLKKNKIKNVIPHFGEVFTFGQMVFTVVSDSSISYDNLNDTSIVMKLDHLGNSFLFTGDAESKAERNILDSNVDIECDVLQLGHHGSSTSTTAAFLYRASPIYGVISCGENNEYGHPHKTIMSRLDIQGVKVYRNDIHGDITCVSNYDGVYFVTEKGEAKSVYRYQYAN